jgi:hypothetical protein
MKKYLNSLTGLRKATGILTLSGLALLATPVAAEDQSPSEDNDENGFSAVMSVGMEYDDNLSVIELDQFSSEDDISLLVDLDLRYNKALGPDTEAEFGYAYSRSFHQDFDEFDIQSHQLSADINHQFGDTKGGLTYRFFDFELDNEQLLDYQQISPYVSRLFGSQLYTRASYTYSRKDYDAQADRGRDAKTDAVDVDAYYFLDGSKLYLSASYGFRDENANAAQYDYEANIFKVGVTKKARMMDYDTKMKLSYRYEDRDYSSVTPSIGVARDDTRKRTRFSWEWDINDDINTIFEYEYNDNSSNLSSADYDQNLVSMMVEYAFN